MYTDFPGKNKKVVCTTYNFLQEFAITQKFNIVDLDIAKFKTACSEQVE